MSGVGEYDTVMECPYCDKKLIVSLFDSVTKKLYSHLTSCSEYEKIKTVQETHD